VFTDRFGRPVDDPEPDDLRPVASRVRVEKKASRVQIVGRVVLLLMLISLTVAVAYLLIPSAVITITPAQTRVTADATIKAVADPETGKLDVEAGVIPAIIARTQIEQTATIPATGSQDLSSTPATGSVVFINKTNGSIRIPAGTRVSTSAGTPIVFQTVGDATVSAGVGLQAEVPVEAVESASGDVGNVDSGQINAVMDAALAERLDVRNISPTVGGQSRKARLISQTDHDRLIDILRQQLQDQAYTEMLPRLETSQFIIPETIHIAEERSDWMTFDHAVGDVADSLTLTMRAVVEATVVDETLAQQIAFARLAGQIPHGHVVRPETVIYQRGGQVDAQPGGSVNFDMTCSGLVVAQINISELQQSLAGRTPEEAAGYLVQTVNLAAGTNAEIALSPSGLARLPLLPLRITIRTQSAG
jgi:hypothetical protein